MALIKSISGIRGTIGGRPGEALTPIDIVKYSTAFGVLLKQNCINSKKIVIGRDARVSGQLVSNLVAASLQSLGFDVIDLALSTTPTVEIAVTEEEAAGGIIITASHNPIQWNAMKLLNSKGEFISASEGARLLEIASSASFEYANIQQLGCYSLNENYLQLHIYKILGLPLVDTAAISTKKFRIIVDAVNSTGAIAVPMLLTALGLENIEIINATVDGIFQHNPEPLPEHLTQLRDTIKSGDFDLGIAVDPDVDRLVFYDENGESFGEEYTLVAVAEYILSHKKGATVSNLSSTMALKDITEAAGCQYYTSAIGEVNVVEKMKAVNAVIGGEGNGGIIYPELHYGRDALVGIALFLTHLAKSNCTVSELRSKYPDYFMSKCKTELSASVNLNEIFTGIQEQYKNEDINREDGLKINFKNEWVHMRASNTEPIIRIYTESSSAEKAEKLLNNIMNQIAALSTN